MLSAEIVSQAIERMSLLSFFPPASAWPALAELIRDMCWSDEQVEWLSRRAIKQWSKWEGPRELRALFCSRFPPRDGEEADSALPQFSEGYPSEFPQIAPPIPKQLTAGEASNDAELQQILSNLSAKASMNGAPPVLAPTPVPRPSLKEAEAALAEARAPRKSPEQIQAEIEMLQLALAARTAREPAA